jgi:hypothetical protein
VLAQVLGGLEAKEFTRGAAFYPMCRAPSAISAHDHFATMVFAQLIKRRWARIRSFSGRRSIEPADATERTEEARLFT